MKKLLILSLSCGVIAAPLFAKEEVSIVLKNQSNIPIVAIRKRIGCAKIIRGEWTACSGITNIAPGKEATLRGSKKFNIAIHHQKPGQKMRFMTKYKVKNGETLIFPSDSFKVLKGRFPAVIQISKPIVQPKTPTIPPAPPVRPTTQKPVILQAPPKKPKMPDKKTIRTQKPSLLEQIREGKKLKSVPEAERKAIEQRRKEARKTEEQKMLEKGLGKMRLPEQTHEQPEGPEGVWD